MGFGGWIFLAIVAGLAVWAIAIYNGLVVLRNRFKNAFAQIDVQLKRRYDLIPNLVEVAKGYMKHERETLDAVIKARNVAQGAAQAAQAAPGDTASSGSPDQPRASSHSRAQAAAAGSTASRGKGVGRSKRRPSALSAARP